ncbi:MAG: bifunctional riboflavin kinase/FAD synthetase [Gammaproteobacteria bacterium]|nr:MAG: bifunctional riboflavin kinase/FAD synthetase [Gammaproteobacteria bacterium]
MTTLITQLERITPAQQNGILTIGKFDGLHLGHQEAIRTIQDIARIQSRPHLLMTFEPTPLEYFMKDEAPPRLTSFSEKMRLLERMHVENVICLHFDRMLASLPADAFIKKILIEKLRVRHIVIGKDFRFGSGRQGSLEMLKRLGETNGFHAEALPTIMQGGSRVSSTRVRDALQSGDLTLARTLLGRDYAMTGRVIYGTQQGRSIGFPTANITVHRHRPALTGVFVVEVEGIEKTLLPGVANLGTRPTVHGNIPLLEVHLLNFKGSLYGRRLTVHFRKKLRDERRFPSFEALQKQIRHDAICARNFFNLPTPEHP